MEFEIGDSVEIVNMPWSERNGRKGKIAKIYPAGLYSKNTIIQVDHGGNHHGQYSQDQTKKI